MAFVKRTLAPINTRAADATFDFEEPYIQSGIISGKIYSANAVSYGLPKPSYLQIAEDSAVVTVTADQQEPLRLVFALGIHDANTGGEVGAWRSFTSKTVANNTVTVSVSGSAWVYAEINENGEPNNPNVWTVDYAHETSVGKTYTTSTTEPTSPTDGDVWFDVTNNKLFKYNNSLTQWEYKKRVYLGEAGVGTDGYIYSIKSWFPGISYANYQDTFYLYYENPWAHYDGVSFTTNGQYTAMEASVWANNATIGQAVAANRIAMEAIANSASAMASIAVSQNTLTYIANSSVAMGALVANSSAISFLANSTIAQTAIQTSNNELALLAIANSATALQGVVNNSQTTLLYDIAKSANAYSLVVNNSALYNVVANSTTGPIFATGGNTVSLIDVSGSAYRVHEFTGLGTLDVLSIGSQPTVEYLVIAGGGGSSDGENNSGDGGGGAGGYRTNVSGQLSGGSPGAAEGPLSLTKQSYVVTVGAGGAGVVAPGSDVQGNSGSNSSFATITSIGGGYSGAGYATGGSIPAAPGGSGGGGGGSNGGGNGPGGSATPGQGHDGGSGTSAVPCGGGGGGAGGAGANAGTPAPNVSGAGGVGRESPITGVAVYRGGGGGGSSQGYNGGLSGAGGNGGGGRGRGLASAPAGPTLTATNGSPNTGGGAGGAGGSGSTNPTTSGGSGFVVVRYLLEKS